MINQKIIEILNNLETRLKEKSDILDTYIEENKGKMRESQLRYKKSGIRIAREEIRLLIKDLKEEINDLYQLCLDEINEGSSIENECYLCEDSIKQLIEENATK